MPCPRDRGAGTARFALYRPSGGRLSLEPVAPFSCRPGQSRRKPPGAPRSKVLWSASSWPSCVAASLCVSLMVSVAGARLRGSGRTVISRRRFLTGVAVGLAPIGGAAHAQEYKAQQAAKVARIGWLAASLAATPHLPEAFRQGLRDLGYVEGRNVVIAPLPTWTRFSRVRSPPTCLWSSPRSSSW